MDFALTEEQQLIVKTTREFVESELYPYEQQVEETGELDEQLRRQLRAKAIDAGLFAANMPAEKAASEASNCCVIGVEPLGPTNVAEIVPMPVSSCA